MSNPNTLLKQLAPLTGPIGPFVSFEDHLQAIHTWKSGMTIDALPILYDGLRLPDSELQQLLIEPEEGRALILEALGVLGKAYPTEVKETALKLLSSPQHRVHGISLLGELKGKNSLSDLATLISLDLSKAETMQLACSLGEVGGEGARELLERVKLLPNVDPETIEECDIALGSL